MSPRLRRLSAAVTATLLAATLVACGDDDGSSTASADDALESLTITGEPGKEIAVEWDGKVEVDGTDSSVLDEGDGDEVAEGDQVSAHVWMGNGFTQKQAYSTYDSGSPESFTINDDLTEVFHDAMVGNTVGSRVAVVTVAEEMFGEAGNPALGVGNKDTVVVVIDIVDSVTVLDAPEGEEQPAPAWAPALVQEDEGTITGLDFTEAPKPGPNGRLRAATLVQGTGPKVKKGQTITVDYLGQVAGAKEPFDESYSREPASFAIGVSQVIAGWDKSLVGVEVGSRVILAIPPVDGYGKQGNPDAGIKGTDTLYFVVDVLGAA